MLKVRRGKSEKVEIFCEEFRCIARCTESKSLVYRINKVNGVSNQSLGFLRYHWSPIFHYFNLRSYFKYLGSFNLSLVKLCLEPKVQILEVDYMQESVKYFTIAIKLQYLILFILSNIMQCQINRILKSIYYSLYVYFVVNYASPKKCIYIHTYIQLVSQLVACYAPMQNLLIHICRNAPSRIRQRRHGLQQITSFIYIYINIYIVIPFFYELKMGIIIPIYLKQISFFIIIFLK